MRFMIHGADQKTGRELTVVVDAPDESEAERRALYNDILVSSVARFTAGAAGGGGGQGDQRVREIEEAFAAGTPGLSYEPPEFPPERRGDAPPHPAAAVPRYRDVLYGARWLDRLGLLARWGGGAAVFAGIGLIAITLIPPVRQYLALPAHPVLYLAAAAVVAALGILCVVCGVMVSMTSGLVVAVRDIAQNTFHVAAARPAAAEQAPQGMSGVQRTDWLSLSGVEPAPPMFLDAPAAVEAPRGLLQPAR